MTSETNPNIPLAKFPVKRELCWMALSWPRGRLAQALVCKGSRFLGLLLQLPLVQHVA